jgi:type II secretory pathway component PulF
MPHKYPRALLIILTVLSLAVLIFALPAYTATTTHIHQFRPTIAEILNRRMQSKAQEGLMIAGVTAASTLGVALLLMCCWCRTTSCGSF